MAAPQAQARARARPLLELFNGYAKSTSTRSFAQWSTAKPDRLLNLKSSKALSPAPACYKAPFSTFSCLAAKSKQTSSTRKTQKPPPPQNRAEKARVARKNKAKLQPAQTVATHTERLPVEPESEQLSWRDYAPEGGMPLPGGERSQSQIDAIFQGEEIDVDTGNYVLSVVHWRRMSGALIDVGLDFPETSGVTSDQALKGLEYVRTLLPNVDEAANAETWAEEEQQRLSEDIQARAVKLGLYKAPEGEEPEPESAPEESQQGTAYGRERYGESVLIQTRKANEAAFEVWKAEKERKEAQLAVNAIAVRRGPLELAGGVIPVVHSVQVTTQVEGPLGLKFNLSKNVSIGAPQTNAWLAPVERKPWVKYYEQQAEIIKENVVPQMNALKRLGPSFLVLLAVLAGCYYLSENYTPPPKSARVFPDSPPAVATLYALTGILFASFIMGRIPPFWRSYNKYMTVVPAYPHALSIIGATFRHDTFKHLLSNVISLWLFGLMLHDDVGRGTFLAIYLSSGVLGSYASLAYNVAIKQWAAYVFGASGSVLGVAAAACTLHPNAKMNIFGYDIPISAWVFLAIFGGLELSAAISRMKTTIDHAGHLGGIAMGMAAAGALRLRAQQQRSADMQRVDNPSELANKAGEDA
ncbi:hypothetical protein AC578_7953 [Pseudocercospora eumusae]|uniref:Peptidase S54 rhomboid domain-containing protein n=1 Tax=Pseudocercospora eumusae TaxID=321146 RepID=A0A139HP60_9PEZI|nr:hypothetical protein AC578_7953 [Pseudocercospora eumusae]